MIEPTDVIRVFEKVRREAKRDDPIDRLAIPGEFYIRETGGGVGSELSAKAILRSRQDFRFVTRFPKRLHQCPCNDPMPAFYKRNIGRCDEDFHGLAGFFAGALAATSVALTVMLSNRLGRSMPLRDLPAWSFKNFFGVTYT